MSLVIEFLIAALIVGGGFFALVGSYGLVTLPGLLARLHAPTKATTLGVGSVLTASMLYFTFIVGDISVHEVSILVFLFLTAPITANFLAKAYLHLVEDARKDLPPTTAENVGWSTFDPPHQSNIDPPTPSQTR